MSARLDADDTRQHSTCNNRVTQSGSLAVDASFQFIYVRDLGTVDSLLINVQ